MSQQFCKVYLTELEEFGLEHYEISPVEPLHDVKGYLINIIDEIRVSVTGEVKKEVELICTSVLNKDALRGSDYCKGAILILSALQKLQPQSALTVLLQSAVEISEILYSNQRRDHHKLCYTCITLPSFLLIYCTELFSKPRLYQHVKCLNATFML